MELPTVTYKREEFLETHTGNKVSRRSLIRGSTNIHLNGKCVVSPGVVIRGDLGKIKIGRYTIVREDAVLRPSYKKAKGQLKYINLVIGDNVYIGEGTIICANKIGSNVYIGSNCIIGHRANIRDNCRIEDGTVLCADTEVPSFTVFGGKPGQFLCDMTESASFLHKELTWNYYNHFVLRSE